MFRLHELKRRQVCRIAFVMLCIAPTACAVAWGLSRRMSGHADAYAAELSQATGLRTSFGAVSHPRPLTTLVHDLSLADGETGQALARVRTLEVDRDDDEMLLRASNVEIEATGAVSLWEPIERELRRGRDEAALALRLIAGEATWRGSVAAQTFNDIDARIVTIDEGRQAEISFRPAGSDVEKSVVLRVMRCVQDREATTHVTLETGTTALPCALVAAWLPGIEHLGERAAFGGSMEMKLTNNGWDGTIRGDLSGIDLDALVTSQFPHTLSGEAQVHIEHVHVIGGRVVEASGTVTAGPGAISRSLLVSGSQRLKLTASTSASKEAMLRFERLQFDFILNDAGLQLTGRCAAGAVLVDASSRVLWSSPSEQSQPIVAVVQTLVPASQLHVPATIESEWLIRHLPVPRIVAPREAANAPSGHLKR